MHTKFWYKSLKKRDHLEDLGIDERIILKCVLKKQDGRVWAKFVWLTLRQVASFLRTQ
jgi:hypothetical protein